MVENWPAGNFLCIIFAYQTILIYISFYIKLSLNVVQQDFRCLYRGYCHKRFQAWFAFMHCLNFTFPAQLIIDIFLVDKQGAL